MSADPKIINLNLASAQAKVDANARHATARGHLVQVRDGRGNPVKGIYSYPARKGFYHRPEVDGRSKTRKLKATTISKAEIERANITAGLAKYHAGLAKNPLAPRIDTLTVRELCHFYLKKGCPRKNTVKIRTGQDLIDEQKRVATLIAWSGSTNAWQYLTAEHWRQYAVWRKKRLRFKKDSDDQVGKGGDRQIDKERITLSNIFRCAIRHRSETNVEKNPVIDAEFETFRDPDKVKHCRDTMPETGDELHAIARYAFNSGFVRKAVPSKVPLGTKGTRRWQLENEEIFGWLTLFKAAIGHRITALLKLRIDARTKAEPGFIAGRKLYLFQSETSKGTYGHREIDRHFQECIDAHRAWLRLRHPNSLWYFPSPLDDQWPVTAGAFTRWLARVCPAMDLPHRTPHGLRAFRVNVLRSEGHSLEEAAIRVGHRSLGKLILSTYGKALDYKLTWEPLNGPPAYEEFACRSSPQLELGFMLHTAQHTSPDPTPPDSSGHCSAAQAHDLAQYPTETGLLDGKPDQTRLEPFLARKD